MMRFVGRGVLVVWMAAWGGVAGAQRLPGNVRPEHYTLALTPDLATATFAGTETIDVTLLAPAKTVTLNALDLKIQSVTAGGQTGTVSFDESKEQATFTFPETLKAGHAAISVAYTGILNDKLRGFYLSKTKTRSYAVTQFESTDARRAFPCFDEPALKATFDVSLTVDKGDTVISNTNMISDKPAGGDAGPAKHTVAFATTPKMSTYLVAFLVGDFACTKGNADDVPIRVCSTPDKITLTPFAVAAAEHFLRYYDTYFGIKYPMPKLDLIAIPDFEAGAMENFGAITYRETELLLDANDASIAEKKRVSVVVAHEMAHQWFGDMVTMQWWDNLWLNEGFATWMESKAASEWHPEWNFAQDDADSLNETLNYDSARTTRPIRQSVDTPAQIAELFDGIAYGKAGAVIGMVENWIGPKVFEQGVHHYLAAHLYGNATAEDFWNAQTKESRQPVDEVMGSFIDKPGVPLLTFSALAGRNYPVAEQRFFLDAPDGQAKEAGWTIPVCAKTAGAKTSGAAECRVLGSEAKALKFEGKGGLPFFYANADDKGYYRVAYTPEQLKAITAVAETALTVPERIGYLGDRWALTRAGQGSVGDYLDLALALKQDPNAQVLEAALDTMAQIRNRIATDEDRDRLNAVIRAQFGPVYQALGAEKEDEPYAKEQIRSELYGALGEADDPAVLAHARQVADDLFNGRKVTENNMMESVAMAAGTGDYAFYQRVQTVAEKTDDPELGEESLKMLTQFHAPELVIRTLEYATSGQVRNQDSWVLIAIELSQRETRDLAWAWVEKNWDKVKAQFTTASGANVVSATGSFCTQAKRDDVASFFATHKVEAADRTLAKALDSIDACVKLRAAQEPKLHAWLAAQAK
jgi:aminopeptidase N/puromycin-sensitive aminopeptidase